MIDLGDFYPLTIDITDADRHPANATSVTLTVTLPDLTTDTPAPINPTVGRYQCDYPTVQAGRHVARWVATGENASTYVETFDVREALPGLIVSLRDAKLHLNEPLDDTSNDEELRGVIEAATAPVEDVVGPVVVRTCIDVDNEGGPFLSLNNLPVVSLTSLVPILTGGTSYQAADLDLTPDTGMVWRLDGGRFRGPVRVTYKAGRPIVPANISQGTKEIIRHMWETQRGHSGAGARPGFGEEDMVLTGSGYAIPRRAMELLAPHRKAPLIA